VPKTFDALGDFCDSLREIDILCDAAQVAQADQRKYSAFNKAALLLIAGKFETFSESIVEEFVFKLNALSLRRIPSRMQFDCTTLSMLCGVWTKSATGRPKKKLFLFFAPWENSGPQKRHVAFSRSNRSFPLANMEKLN
jgi:hypothetical protein